MTVGTIATQVVEQAGPKLIGLIHTAFGTALNLKKLPVGEVIEEAVKATTGTVADKGISQGLFDARRLLTDLKNIVVSPELASDKSDCLKKIIEHIEQNTFKIGEESGFAISEGNKSELEAILQQLTGSSQSQVQPQGSVSSTSTNSVDIEAEVQKRVQEKVKEIEASRHTSHEHLEPVDKIIAGVGGIVTGEFRNMNSEVGWLMKAFCKWKGITLNEELVSSYLRSFADDKFKSNLEKYIKGTVSGHNDPLSLCEGLNENDKFTLPWVGTLINIGGSTPSWVFDGMALLGTAIDYGAELLHNVPFLGRILRLPMGRKLLTGVGQFAGRFAKDIELVGKGATELKAKLVEEASQGAAATIKPAVVPT